MLRISQALFFLSLVLPPRAMQACACQTSYGSCNEVVASNLVFIGTVEAIEPIFLNRWSLTSRTSLQSLNNAYLDAQEHPSEAALANLKDIFLKSFPDLAADEKQKLLDAKTTSQVASLFYSTLNSGQRIRLKVRTLFKHEEDDDDDVPNKARDNDKESEEYFDISTPFGDCGVEFQAGETYLVYANNDENSGLLSTTVCTRTRRLSDAGEDLGYLFFYKNQRKESTRVEGFVTSDELYQANLNKMHDPDTVKAPAAGVVVELQSDRTARFTESDGKGRFVFDGLRGGDYALSAFAGGYPAKTELLSGPRAFQVEEKSCSLQIILLPKPDGK